MSLKYEPASVPQEMPARSTSLFALLDNTAMAACALTGIGVCVIHGQNQDAMNRFSLPSLFFITLEPSVV